MRIFILTQILTLVLNPALIIGSHGTHEDERTVLYKTKSLDGTKPNTNLKLRLKLTLTIILTLTLN